MESERLRKRSAGASERKAIGREWMASQTSVGARRKGSQGACPTGNERLNCVVSVSKYSAKAAAGVIVPVTRRVTEPLSLTLVVIARGRVQLASQTRRAAMSRNEAAISVA